MVSEDMVTQLVTHLRQEAHLPTWKVLDAECGLSLRVTETKATYFFRVRRPKQISRSLGDFGDISTIEAYQKGLALAVTLRNGDPLPASKTRPSDLTVRQKSLSWLLKTWREDEVSKPYPRWSPTDRKAAVKFLGLIGNYVEPHFQGLSFTKISGEELADFLTDFHRHHPSSAKSLLPWIEAAFMWAERKGLCSDGYQKAQRMRMLVKDARWRRHGPPVHHPALPVSDVPEFMAELREVGGTTARCLEVVILTCSRVASVTQMRWCDIDLQRGIWRCPKETMKVKTNGDHVVYLSAQATQILASMPRLLPGGRKAEYVFSTARGEKICNALTKVIVSINQRRKKRSLNLWIDPEQSRLAGKERAPTPHGFRATFKSWTRSDKLGNWKRYDNVAVERCMHHYTKDMYGGAYDREDFPEQQRKILQDWADFCYSYRPPLD